MKMVAIVVLAFVSGTPFISAQSSNTIDRNYKLLREDENWSFLKDRTLRQDFWDPIKYIPLRKSAEDWYLTIGGEAREVWEQIGNDNWGQQPFMNGYLNERYMPYVDLHYGGHVRTFIELKSGLNSFRAGGPRPIDEKKLDFQAAFLEIGTSSEHTSIDFRIGRQELEYGSGRLIDVREGPNVRLSFDGFMVKSKINSWQLDGFAMRPDEDESRILRQCANFHSQFLGHLCNWRSIPQNLTRSVLPGAGSKAGHVQRGTAQEVRHSVGARISHPIATERRGWDFDNEALWQFGTFGSANILAWTVATETGYRFPVMPLKPRFSAKADISSGDHPASSTLGTFNPLYPKGNYFGVLATTGPGPINFIDVHPRVELTLPHDVSVSADWIVQWRQSLEDGVYASAGLFDQACGWQQGTLRGRQARHRDSMAGESPPLVSGRLPGSFMQEAFSKKRSLGATSTIGLYGPDTSSRRSN